MIFEKQEKVPDEFTLRYGIITGWVVLCVLYAFVICEWKKIVCGSNAQLVDPIHIVLMWFICAGHNLIVKCVVGRYCFCVPFTCNFYLCEGELCCFCAPRTNGVIKVMKVAQQYII